MFCWGNTVHGELGLGGIEEEQIFYPRELKFPKAAEIKQVACGWNHTAMLTSGGELYTCGNNDYGQLGHHKSCKKPEHVSLLDAYSIAGVACGSTHTLALNEWGQLFSWGSNLYGQLGGGSTDMSETPKIVKTIASCYVVQTACGLNHSLALTNKGELFAWGCNRFGQLGTNSSVAVETAPKLVVALAGVPIALIACGSNHSFAVSRSGGVFGWGKNDYGQVGTGDTQPKPVPCLLRNLRSSKVKYVACGEDFSVFLTKDGGVFTCGAGMYGKLGHGSVSNELLPRKISELMGSTITQVACGRHHTLALMPSQGRVYGFGLGGAGQLGGLARADCKTPQPVQGPWAPPAAPHEGQLVVKRLYAGGDQCFAAVAHRQDQVAPDDCRVYPPSSQIWCVTLEDMQRCSSVPVHTPVDQDLLTYLETVFGSLACLSASFLLPNDEHSAGSTLSAGINFREAEQVFTAISRIENDTVKSVIMNCIVQNVLPNLVSVPSHIEAMRLYLTVPLYHEFNNARHCESLQNPFAASVLNLKADASKILDCWWRIIATDYFERLIRIYKDVVMHMIQQTKSSNERVKSTNLSPKLRVPLDMLKHLNHLNYSVDGLKVPYVNFYLPDLTSTVEIEYDYVTWIMDHQTKSGSISFCDYPFLFDAKAKTVLLRTDQSLQRHRAVNQAAAAAYIPMFFNMSAVRGVEIFCELYVSRDNIVQDAIRELMKHDEDDLKKPLKVHFLGEEADDAGGVTKEFFLLLLREILDPKFGMFRSYEEQRTIWFNEFSFEDPVMYCLVGFRGQCLSENLGSWVVATPMCVVTTQEPRFSLVNLVNTKLHYYKGLVCGLAIYNFTIIDLPFPLVLYKKLLDSPVGLQDLTGLSPTLAKSLQDILDYEGDDLEDVFCLTFEVTEEVFGEVRSIPLKPGGCNIPVSQHNKKEFVDLYVDHLLNTGVEAQFSAFKDGFLKVCGSSVLKLFHPRELMAVVVGNENYDWVEFERNAQYRGGYSASDPTIIMFWKVFHQLSPDDKRKFLLFLTGSDRVPIQGMKELKIYIQPTTDDRCLPVAHTCFNLLDLPRYKTQEKLRYKLLQAIQQTEGFSLV